MPWNVTFGEGSDLALELSDNKIMDEALGELKYDGLWFGIADIEPYGEVELVVDGGNEGAPPNEKQQEAFQKIELAFPALKASIDQALLDFYLENRGNYLAMAIDPESEVPEISQIEQLDQILESGPSLFIGQQLPGQPEVVLSWQVVFDDEHDLTVEISDGKVSSVVPN